MKGHIHTDNQPTFLRCWNSNILSKAYSRICAILLTPNHLHACGQKTLLSRRSGKPVEQTSRVHTSLWFWCRTVTKWTDGFRVLPLRPRVPLTEEAVPFPPAQGHPAWHRLICAASSANLRARGTGARECPDQSSAEPSGTFAPTAPMTGLVTEQQGQSAAGEQSRGEDHQHLRASQQLTAVCLRDCYWSWNSKGQRR